MARSLPRKSSITPPFSMTPEKRKRIIDRHRDALLRFGYSANALYWSNREIQELRFQILLEIGIPSGSSVLDVGCGFGDLYGYMKRQAIETNYTGIDLSAELLAKGAELYPGANFFCGDLFDFKPAAESFDYVLLSGALNEVMDDNGEYAKRVITSMYQTCRKGLAFNLLNANEEWLAKSYDLQSFIPSEMLSFCQQLGGDCQLRDDYLSNDFTILMTKT